MKYNFHTHSHFDDGKENLESYVIAAVEKVFSGIGFSGHSPLSVNTKWSIPLSSFPAYVAQIKRLKEQYKELIPVYLGLEIDYIPGVSEDFAGWIKTTPLDYCIGSVHLVNPDSKNKNLWFIDGPREGYLKGIDELFGGDIKKAVTAFFSQSIEMVSTQPLNIIGHLDKVKMNNREEFFSQEETWYQQLVDKLLKAIREKKTIVEVNTRGKYTGKCPEFFPSPFVLEKCLHMGIPVMVNADAHLPSQIDNLFSEAIDHLKDIGFKKMTTPFFEVII